MAARAGGVRNDCYYRAQQGLWICTCGMPNALRRLRCARCGADRLWLETNMDPERSAEAPLPAAPAAPETAAVPESIVSRFVPAPFREEGPPPPVSPEPSVPETGPEEDSARIGRITAIAVAAVLALTLGVLCAIKLLMPNLRYREALREEAAGNYDRAAAIFESLGDFRDSADRIGDSRVRKAIQLMGNGGYQEALELLESVDSREKRIPDCLYALGVEAYNAGDLDAAAEYLEQLEERFPSYKGNEPLRRCCAYGMGNRTAFEASAMSNTQLMLEVYQKAIDWFDQAGSYGDAAERILECRYRIACIYEEMGELSRPIREFGELGDYKDSAIRRQNCMYSYVQLHLPYDDEMAWVYLEELAAMGHPEASALWARFNGEGFSFTVTANQDHDEDFVTDLSKIRIDYQIDVETEDLPMPLLLVTYALPDGKSGQGYLNLEGRIDKGSRTWEDLHFPTYCEADGFLTLRFYDNMFGATERSVLYETTLWVLESDSASETPVTDSPAKRDGEDGG